MRKDLDGSDIVWENMYVKPIVFKRDDYRCRMCGSDDGLELHHLSYEEDRTLSDYLTLCKKCHSYVTAEGRGFEMAVRKRKELTIEMVKEAYEKAGFDKP